MIAWVSGTEAGIFLYCWLLQWVTAIYGIIFQKSKHTQYQNQKADWIVFKTSHAGKARCAIVLDNCHRLLFFISCSKCLQTKLNSYFFQAYNNYITELDCILNFGKEVKVLFFC